MLIRLMFLLLPFVGIAQGVYKDSVFFVTDVWCESVESEAHQRAKILGFEKKIETLRALIHDKKHIESRVDTLISQMDSLYFVLDSIQRTYSSSITEVTTDCQDRELYLIDRLNTVNTQIVFCKKKLNTVKRQRRYLIVSNILLGALVVLM